MSFEETMVCDGCSRVIDGGGRGQMMRDLAEEGGRAFNIAGGPRSTWEEVDLTRAQTTGATTRRHLCGRCTGRTEFYDGVAVPTPRATSGHDLPGA